MISQLGSARSTDLAYIKYFIRSDASCHRNKRRHAKYSSQASFGEQLIHSTKLVGRPFSWYSDMFSLNLEDWEAHRKGMYFLIVVKEMTIHQPNFRPQNQDDAMP